MKRLVPWLASVALCGLVSVASAHGGVPQPPPDPPPTPEGEVPGSDSPPEPPPPPPEFTDPGPGNGEDEAPGEPPGGNPAPTDDGPTGPDKGPTIPTGPDRAGKTKGARSSDHWTRWWYPNRDHLIDLFARAPQGGTTPGSRQVTTGGELWREEAKVALAQALSADDEDISSGAAIALGKAGDPIHAAALVAVLLDNTRQQPTREAAALALGLLPVATGEHSVGSAAALEALSKVAASRDEADRLRAISVYGLGLRGDLGALPLLLDLSNQTTGATWDLRAAAISSLGLLGNDIALPDLEATLAGGRNRVVRRKQQVRRVYAAHGLARLDLPACLAALRDAATTKDDHVRRAAVLALGAVEAAKADDQTIKLLVRALHRDKDQPVRNMAALSLGRLGHEDGIEALRYGYRKGSGLHQPYAALALGLMARERGDPKLTSRLVEDLRRRATADLRGALSIALGLAGNRDAIPVLREIVFERGNPDTRAHAALALGLLRDTESAPKLRGQLASPADPVLQREIALALGLMGDREAVTTLVDLVENGSSLYTQGSAAVSLGRIGGRESVKVLTALLQDEDRPGLARGMAAVGLGLLLDRTEGRGIRRIGTDLQWYLFTSSVNEVVTIL